MLGLASVLACMHIFIFFIVGSSFPICTDFKAVSNLSVACSSEELQSVHARFWLLCLGACTYLFFNVGCLSPICYHSKTVSNLSVTCSSTELQSVHTRFFILCLRACTNLIFSFLDHHGRYKM